MSGHSKWSTIRHKKAINDAKKGKIFSKYGQLIAVAARDGGADINMNPNLRLLVEKAKSESMPVANIQRAIDRGAGTGEGGPVIFEAASYEGFGPEGVQVIVDVLTENKTRAVADIRNIFNENGCTLGEQGSVSWNFDHKGAILVRCAHLVKSEKFGGEDIVEEIDANVVLEKLMSIPGVVDIQDEQLDEGCAYTIYTQIEDMAHVRDEIFNLGYIVKSAELVKIPKMLKKLSQDQLIKVRDFIDKVDDYEDVQNIWLDVDPDELENLE